MFIYPYKQGSNSAKTLKQSLGAKIILLKNSKFKGDANKIVINWGNSTMTPELQKCVLINHPDRVKVVTNKRTFFQLMKGQPFTPENTTDKAEALKYLEKGKIVVREKLTGHSGEGIVILSTKEEFDKYPHKKAGLYVKYIPKKQEYRIHIAFGKVFDIQRKARNKDVADHNVNWEVRNHANGFIYMRGDAEKCPEEVLKAALSSHEITGLHFGAYDVIWNAYTKKAYVLEVNTAPGLEGQTGVNYANVMKNIPKVGVPRRAHRPKQIGQGWAEAAFENVPQPVVLDDF